MRHWCGLECKQLALGALMLGTVAFTYPSYGHPPKALLRPLLFCGRGGFLGFGPTEQEILLSARELSMPTYTVHPDSIKSVTREASFRSDKCPFKYQKNAAARLDQLINAGLGIPQAGAFISRRLVIPPSSYSLLLRQPSVKYTLAFRHLS